jgi:predicted dinucleotide-binding enzyme
MTSIGILGSGRVASALASAFARAGHAVTIGSRAPAAAAEKWSGPVVRHASYAETARDSAIVINATPGDTSLDWFVSLRSELDGKVLVDVANATAPAEDCLPGALCYPNRSLAEQLQRELPRTRVVKTLNTTVFTVMVDPRILATPPTIFLSGDNDDAKKTVLSLLTELGWPAEWIIDLGDITTARGPEAVALLTWDF